MPVKPLSVQLPSPASEGGRLMLSQRYLPDAHGFLFDMDPYDLWTFTHPNQQDLGKFGGFRIFQSPPPHPLETLLELFQASENKHAGHPGRHEFVPGGELMRGYDLMQLQPLAAPGSPAADFQDTLLVVFSEKNTLPLGAARFGRAIAPKDNQSITLRFELPFLYVRPEFRGLGFGAALARACGKIGAADLLHAAGLAAPGQAIHTAVLAPPQGPLGERIRQAVLEEIEMALDTLRRQPSSPGAEVLVLPPDSCGDPVR